MSSFTILLARQKRWLWAVLAGMVATLARLNGLALFFFLGAEYMIQLAPALQKRWAWHVPFTSFLLALRPKNMWKHRYAFLFFLIPLTFVGYLAYLQGKFGDWNVFFSSVEVWNRSQLTFPLQTFWRYFKILVLYPRVHLVYWVAWGEALFTALYLLVLLFTWGRVRFSYWMLMLVHLMIPMVTGTLQGMPRYGLHLYPLFLILAGWLWKSPKWAQAVYFIGMLVLQVLYLSAFVQGYFVA
ncbi:hypothetical protein LRY60_03445 [Candidatus Woesebacteria bacterium]|nr:hypothetical protein [Candidatus Woesebacteria bacterium]